MNIIRYRRWCRRSCHQTQPSIHIIKTCTYTVCQEQDKNKRNPLPAQRICLRVSECGPCDLWRPGLGLSSVTARNTKWHPSLSPCWANYPKCPRNGHIPTRYRGLLRACRLQSAPGPAYMFSHPQVECMATVSVFHPLAPAVDSATDPPGQGNWLQL